MVVAASTAGQRSSQQKLNAVTANRTHPVGQSNGCGEGKQLSAVLKGLEVLGLHAYLGLPQRTGAAQGGLAVRASPLLQLQVLSKPGGPG